MGNVQAPALEIPQRVTDLIAAEYGSQIHVQFTIPPLTTEGLPLKSLRSVELYVAPPINPWDQNAWGATAKRFPIAVTGPGPVNHDVPAGEWIGKEVVISVRATGPKGKISEWSNIKTLPIRPPIPTPADLTAENQPNAIELTWHGSAQHYRIFRAAGDVEPELLAESDQPSYRDAELEYGTQYRYYVQATAGELQQSETAGPLAITAEDKFPPSVPAGLSAEQGTNSIELSWERNTDPRFQGYNLYRSADGGPFEKIASLIASPAYSDRNVQAGKMYRYQVSAVGTNSLESARSAAVEITGQ